MADKNTTILLVLDGFGYKDSAENNAIKAANTPTYDKIWQNCPRTFIHTSGLAVGLPDGQMGNSEVGHMTLGAGRVIYQNFTRINKSIEDGSFFDNSAYCNAIDKAVATGNAVHVLGLLSPGGVHSHQAHLFAMAKLAVQRGAEKLYFHAILDGRDCSPKSATEYLQALEDCLASLGKGKIASVVGRFYALDRDNRWERVQPVYDLMTNKESEFTAPTALAGLQAAYEREETDEFVKPTLIVADGETPISVADGDSLIFMNFRPDRAREISRCFVDDNFDGFSRKQRPQLADFVMTTEYASDIAGNCAFPPESISNGFGEYIAAKGKSQLRIAETEKYAHVTFFFNGGEEEVFTGEDRILVPSPKVATYDLMPEMSALEVTEKLVAAIESEKYDAIICNYANCDQVGHTGVFDAAVKAVEVVDDCLAKVFDAGEKVGAHILVTADHGNVEEMFDEAANQPHTQHTTFPVPIIYVGNQALSLTDDGSLADVAPTMLSLMEETIPEDMTGKSLIAPA